ncbi:hypothetical protein BY996DRAFT_6421509 [Phakopsora pachyrhizi]|nr:hypothetical protein BY996DRAFT_6421509 [Phakopsora pachyrhizi]
MQLLPIPAPPKPFSASKRKSTPLESKHLPTKRKRVEKCHYQSKLDDQGQLSLHEKPCQPSSQLEESARSDVFNPAATASGCILKGILHTKSSNVQQALNQFSNLATERVSLLHETLPTQEAHLCCGQSTLVDGHAHYKSPASKTDNYKSNTSQPKRSVDNFNHKKNLIHVDNRPPQNPTPRPEFPARSQSLNKAEVALDNPTQSSNKSKKQSIIAKKKLQEDKCIKKLRQSQHGPSDKQILIDSHKALDISQISVASFKHQVESVTATTEASDNRGPLPSDISKNDFKRLECFAPDAATLDLCQAANGILPVVLSTIASLIEDPKITKNTLKSNYALTETTSNSGPSTLGTSVLPKSVVALSTKHNSLLVEIANSG